MLRRTLLQRASRLLLTIPFLGACQVAVRRPFRRVRPSDPEWPRPETWDGLKRQVGGRLVTPHSPLVACQTTTADPSCTTLFTQLENPYFIGDNPALTQTLGWADAWVSSPSAYAVAAASSADVAAAVNFARTHRLRLVIKGGGHSYQGTSSAPDSLLIWTRAMDQIELHEAFVPQGAGADESPTPAVSIGAGATWMHVYEAVTTRAGRYVQGGGCGTVGVAGLIQSGGFGSFSKAYGMASAGLLEAEVVTADGQIRVVNRHRDPELFWGLKGGGGGTLGVVTRLTLRTRDLPDMFASVSGTVRATSERAFRDLVAYTMQFYRENLFNPGWGEQIVMESDLRLRLKLLGQGYAQAQLEALWQPFRQWVIDHPDDVSFEDPLTMIAFPARDLWNAEAIAALGPGLMTTDGRPGAPTANVYWTGDGGEAGQYLHGYRSAWLPATLLEDGMQDPFVDALLACTKSWSVSLHFNKGLAGAHAADIDAARDTATNPDVLDAFALAIIAGFEPRVYPGVPGHEPDMTEARTERRAIDGAMAALLKAAPGAGSYVSESDYFEVDWQRSFWGDNYPRLAATKLKYDPDGLFFVHHGVGSEEWSADGFERRG